MKIIINNYPESLKLGERQEFPGTTMLEFVSDFGDRFRVSPNEVGDGLSITLLRKLGSDQLKVLPKTSNSIEVK